MRAIWKYELGMMDNQTVLMQEGAKILCVQVQHETPCIWVEVDTDADKEYVIFSIYGTGHKMANTGEYAGTFQLALGALVFHLYKDKL